MSGGAHGFTSVDDQSDPDAWVRLLDRLGEEPFYAAYKARVLELLAPAAGGRYLDVGGGTGAAARALRQVVDVEDQELARRVLNFRADHLLRNGTIAHRVPGLLTQLGVDDLRIEPATLVVRDPTEVDNVMGLWTWAATAHNRGLLSAEEAEAWPVQLNRAVASGRFLYAVTFFITAGTRGRASTG
jgi:hypothetical protein